MKKEDDVVRFFLDPIKDLLAEEGVTDLCINHPGEVFVESRAGWKRHEIPALTYEWADKFVKTASSLNDRSIGIHKTLLSATLPDGERLSVVHPPNCEPGTIAITIRKPSQQRLSHKELITGGLYKKTKRDVNALAPFEEELLLLLDAGEYGEFMELAVRTKRTIMIGGPTGVGKTTLVNALMEFMHSDERIVTIEDAREVYFPNNPNCVHLLYESDGKKENSVSARELIQMALRMRPDRIFQAELRGPETLDFFVSATSGHPGSISTVHSGTIPEVFRMLAFRVSQNPDAGNLRQDEIMKMLRSSIDVICQYAPPHESGSRDRSISEIYYDPRSKRKLPEVI